MTFRLIHILAEGKTEQIFIEKSLRPHFRNLGTDLAITLARPGRSAEATGGVRIYEAIRSDVIGMLSERGSPFVTTMIDYYGRPTNMPGNDSLPDGTPRDKAIYLESKWGDDIGYSQRFVPHYALHEFEALMFCDPEAIASATPGIDNMAGLREIAESVETPEDINDSPETAPSKRLEKFLRYKKALHGPLIAQKIGLPIIRAKCPHFNEWLTKLEGLR
ncbi:MAG: DUF4276 family protein [Rhodospirillales bacterium]|jgi:hypothetical protein|nr:DUF4276 family protein [Rhodospirillales bacterium]